MANKKPKILAGGNPQIPKGSGNAPVQAYLDAIPDWKQGLARRLDSLICETVPDVEKAVKWNTPLYGMGNEEWFIAYHCVTKYLKVTFFRGALLKPVPPVASKQDQVRYVHLHENDSFNVAQLTDWIVQASRLDGKKL